MCALDCDGVDDEIGHGDIAGLDVAAKLTVMCWLLADALNASEGICGKNNQGYLYLSGAADQVAAGQSGVWEKLTGAGTIVTGAWAHWTFAYDGSLAAAARVAIYKNAVSLALTGTDAGATLSDQGAAAVKVGGGLGIVAGFLDAKIALVKIWTATLTAAEIAQEMESYRPIRTADLRLWAPYDDGTFARDYSGQGNEGVVTGALQIIGPPVAYGGDP